MNIAVHESTGIFHLYNEKISYLIGILPDGQTKGFFIYIMIKFPI